MTASIIDGNALSAQLRQQVSDKVKALQARGLTAGLAVILVGDNPASQVYVRNKVKACEQTGIHSLLEKHDASMTEAELLARVHALNHDNSIHGILVQLPLPAHIDAQKVIEAIAPEKDVDGFHVTSAGALMTGLPGYWPCTPHGCMKMLEHIGYSLKGKHALVIGRSNIVGKPMTAILCQKARHADATVTLCHSRTRDVAAHCRRADIIIAAMGVAQFVKADMVRPNTVVMDVGVNRIADTTAKNGSRLVGDVDFAAVQPVAQLITPNPGGVGPMTIAMLMQNTVRAAEVATR